MRVGGVIMQGDAWGEMTVISHRGRIRGGETEDRRDKGISQGFRGEVEQV